MLVDPIMHNFCLALTAIHCVLHTSLVQPSEVSNVKLSVCRQAGLPDTFHIYNNH